MIIPEGYLYIGEHAFARCPKLKKVTLPSTLLSIGKWAFNSCPKLESIIIPGGVEDIADFAFAECKSLKELTVENGVKRIGGMAFDHCVKLDNIIVPNSVKTIDTGAFGNCSGLKNITIPKDAELGGAVFKGCKKLADESGMVISGNTLLDYVGKETAVVIPQGIQVISSCVFECNETIRSITIPDSVKVIGPAAFRGCSGLTEISIPKGVEKIYWFTFSNCYTCNAKYRWVKFYIDDDNDICVRSDAILDEGTCGEECREIILRMIGIIDESYPVFMKARWA